MLEFTAYAIIGSRRSDDIEEPGPMPKRVAVITDATSAGFFFPKWHSYYSGAFGAGNLYVVTYAGLRQGFRAFDLGGLWEVPHHYSDPLRAKLISSLVSSLLLTHDVVVRCDIDEFLVPDPRKFTSLADYVEHLSLTCVTARGIDMLEDRTDALLDVGKSIVFTQRNLAIRTSSLNKTCITHVPLIWCEGFHGANRPPAIDDLYLFHMKFADIRSRSDWFSHMYGIVARTGTERSYFSVEQPWLVEYQNYLMKLPRIDGWRALCDDGFDDRFLSTVNCNSANGIYMGEFFDGGATFMIPGEFGLVTLP